MCAMERTTGSVMSIDASAAEGLQNGIQIQSMSSEWEIQNKWSWCVL